jgi:hypothetical protein
LSLSFLDVLLKKICESEKKEREKKGMGGSQSSGSVQDRMYSGQYDIHSLPIAEDSKKVGSFPKKLEKMHRTTIRWDRLLEYRVYQWNKYTSEDLSTSIFCTSFEDYPSAEKAANSIASTGVGNARLAAVVEQDWYYRATSSETKEQVKTRRFLECPPEWLIRAPPEPFRPFLL